MILYFKKNLLYVSISLEGRSVCIVWSVLLSKCLRLVYVIFLYLYASYKYI